MAIAQDLPGTTGERECVFVRNIRELPAVMRSGKYATTADDHGAIGAWIDDSGNYRCEAMRCLQTVDSQSFTTFKAVKDWYREWLEKIA